MSATRPRFAPDRATLGLAAILLGAAILRLVALDTIPPGLFHDEASYAFDAREVLTTDYRPIYFERNTGGREPLFIYLVAGTMAILGPTELALRLVAATVGVLTVAATYLVGRRFVNARAGLIAAGVLAALPWHVHLSRDGFRAITLPLAAAIAWWLIARAWAERRPVDFALAGVAVGAVFYTYLAGRIFWIAVVLWAGYLAATRFRAVPWRGVGIAALAAILVMAPLAVYYAGHPAIFFARAGQVASSEAISLSGGGLLASLPRVLGMFSLAGDPNWRHNVDARPVFDPVVSIFFYAGILIALRRWRQPFAAAALIWAAAMLLPSALTDEAPHYLRAIGALPAIVLFPAIAVDALIDRLPAARRRWAIGAVAAGLLILGGLTAGTYFGRFGPSVEAHEAYGAAVEAACREAAAIPAGETVLVSHSLYRHATCRFVAPNEPDFRWLDGADAIVWPALNGRPVNYIVPDGTLSPDFVRLLEAGQATTGPIGPTGRPAFVRYRFDAGSDAAVRDRPRPAEPRIGRAGDRLTILGQSLDRGAETTVVYLHWEPGRPSAGGLADTTAASVRLVDRAGDAWAQIDRLGYLDPEWRPGDRVVSRYPLGLPDDAPPGAYHAEVVVYQRGTRQTLPIAGPPGNPPDRLILPEFDYPAGRPADPARLPRPERPIDRAIRPGLRLRGVDLPAGARPGEALAATWHWIVEDPAATGPVPVGLRDAAGRTVPLDPIDLAPGAASPVWVPGQAVRVRPRLRVPLGLPPGAYDLVIGAPDGIVAGSIQVAGRDRRRDAPPIDQLIGANYLGLARLVGLTLDPDPARAGHSLTVDLVWRAEAAADRPLTVFVHLIDAAGWVVAQHDGPPAGGEAPTTTWAAGEFIADRHPIALPAGLPPGEYRLAIGLYDPATGDRRSIAAGATSIDGGAVAVVAPD